MTLSRVNATVDKVMRSPDASATGWCVLRLRGAGEQTFTCVGNFPPARTGQTVTAVGVWREHPSYGRQFQADTITETPPHNAESLVAYLCTALPGSDHDAAARLVAKLGPREALRSLDDGDAAPLNAAGIDPHAVTRLLKHWRRHQHGAELMTLLHGLGVHTSTAQRIYAYYKSADRLTSAVNEVRRNPFALSPVPGVGYPLMNRMAQDLRVPLATPERIDAGLLYCMRHAANCGHTLCPDHMLVATASDFLNRGAGAADRVSTDHITQRLGHLLQAGVITARTSVRGAASCLPELDDAEATIAFHAARLLSAPAPVLALPPRAALDRRLGLTLDDAQYAGLQMASQEKLCILGGGPGTGKTTISRALVAMMLDAGQRIALLAPTGQAADRLATVTGHAATTIHLALGAKADGTWAYHEQRPLERDFVLCDETSMADAPTTAALLRALPARARLVLVGDPGQLPSVGPGNILQDFLDAGVPVTELVTPQRQALNSAIIQVAHCMRAGRMPFPLASSRGDALFLAADSERGCGDGILRVVDSLLARGVAPDDIQTLVPMRYGDVGTDALNRRLRLTLNPAGGATIKVRRGEASVGDRVIHTINDHDRGIYNGSTGRVVSANTSAHTLSVQIKGQRIEYGPERLRTLLPGYAVTIHRAQGSQYPVTIVGVAESHQRMLQRRLLYTAITRAQRLLVVVNQPGALRAAIANDSTSTRMTTLAERLRDALAQPRRRPTLSLSYGLRSA